MKENYKNSKEKAENEALIKAMNYELSGDIGVISNEEMEKYKKNSKTKLKTYKEGSSLRKKK